MLHFRKKEIYCLEGKKEAADLDQLLSTMAVIQDIPDKETTESQVMRNRF
jgi:hypothetical protein